MKKLTGYDSTTEQNGKENYVVTKRSTQVFDGRDFFVACFRAQHHIFQVQSASVNQGDGTGSSGAAATVNCIPGKPMFVRLFHQTIGLH